MGWRVVKTQNWVITGVDNQPTTGWLLTVQNEETGVSFNIEAPSTDPAVVGPIVQHELEKRRGLADLTFD